MILPEIPLTGGTGTALLTVAGLGILGAFAATFLVRRKRSESETSSSDI